MSWAATPSYHLHNEEGATTLRRGDSADGQGGGRVEWGVMPRVMPHGVSPKGATCTPLSAQPVGPIQVGGGSRALYSGSEENIHSICSSSRVVRLHTAVVN